MISLGEAAGTAAIISLDLKKYPRSADVKKIQGVLGIPEFTDKLSKEFGL